MSEEKVLTLRGKKAVWAPGGGSGPIDPKRLPEGYPYKEMGEVVLVEEVLALTADNGGGAVSTAWAFSLVAGNPYKVIYDNEEYTCVAQEYPGAPQYATLGNLSLVGGGSDTGEPFAFAGVSGGYDFIAKSAGEHTIRISEYSEIIHPMAPEFLPAGGGGGAPQRVTFTMEQDDTGYNFTCSHTGAEIAKMAAKGPVLADIQGMYVTAVLAGFVNGLAMFTFAMCHSGTATIRVISVNQNDGTGMNAAIQS